METVQKWYSKLLPIRQVFWIIINGWILALFYLIATVTVALTIIGIPFVPETLKLAEFAFCPVGYTYATRPDGRQTKYMIANVIWLVLWGWFFALMHLSLALVDVATIVGIGSAWENIKLIPLALWPFGRDVFLTKTPTAIAFTTTQRQQPASMV
jgi:uncharacterized membrane protein YccF (DUF307 family)